MFNFFEAAPAYGSITNVRYRYDRYSERAYFNTDWTAHGAQHSRHDVSHRRHGLPPNRWELMALKAVLREAQRLGRADLCDHFNQPHPTDPEAFVVCQAWAHVGSGWAIHLKDPRGFLHKGPTLKCDYDAPIPEPVMVAEASPPQLAPHVVVVERPVYVVDHPVFYDMRQAGQVHHVQALAELYGQRILGNISAVEPPEFRLPPARPAQLPQPAEIEMLQLPKPRRSLFAWIRGNE